MGRTKVQTAIMIGIASRILPITGQISMSVLTKWSPLESVEVLNDSIASAISRRWEIARGKKPALITHASTAWAVLLNRMASHMNNK
jgi:hypothetical protein